MFKEVTPIQYHGSTAQVFSYKRIKVECLTKETLQRFYTLLRLTRPVTILETPAFFLIQYEKKPIIVLKKDDGRLYTLPDQGFSEKEIEHQASFVIRILRKYDLVEELHSKKIKMVENFEIERGKKDEK
ncbi:MAG: hypothetical protein DRP01_10115 [Archaeoglobales archaeon]|nr:MAG: hypothetical protein DRP01_10115 [Archaeoglobales archaeon]